MDKRGTRITTGIRISSRSSKLIESGVAAAYELAEDIVDLALEYAEESVEQGQGPSEHIFNADDWGHQWAHPDTGELKQSIIDLRDTGKLVKHKGFLAEVAMYTDVPYGIFLELGWKSGKGNFFRYQWMQPALEKAINEIIPNMAYSTYNKMTARYTAKPDIVKPKSIKEYLKTKDIESLEYVEEQ